MTYTVHSIFKTVQGEGANMGRLAVFVRFAGCNLWTGQEEDRATARCGFCDTEFVGGDKFDTNKLVGAVLNHWGWEVRGRFAVLTGGEPALQIDSSLLEELRDAEFRIAVETNGTHEIAAPNLIDWICFSPKAGTSWHPPRVDEIRIAWPQEGLDPSEFDFGDVPHWLSPIDGPRYPANVRACLTFIEKHPRWRLNVQAHKKWGLP